MTREQELRAEYNRLAVRVQALTELMASWPLVDRPSPKLIRSQAQELAQAIAEKYRAGVRYDHWSQTWAGPKKRLRLCDACLTDIPAGTPALAHEGGGDR